MKILIIHNKYQTVNIGGEDIVYQNELMLLENKLGKENIFSYEVSNNDINQIKLLFSIWFSWKQYQIVKNIIKENNIDIVHVHNFYPLLTPSIFKAAKKSGAKVIHTLHNYRLWCISGILYRDGYGVCELCVKNKFSFAGIFNKCFRKSLLQSIIAQASFWFYKLFKMFDSIDYFFVLTNFQKDKVKSLGLEENRIILKPNSLSNKFLNYKYKNGYIYVGRIEESKGIMELLKVWKQLDNNYKLTIIGGGELEENLKKKYEKENIIFKGKCSREETLRSIAKSKYLIQPSLWYETFGLTMIEAMSAGVPVIGLNIGTRGDFIENGINGFLCEKDSLLETIKKSYDYIDYKILSDNAVKSAKKFEEGYIVNKQIQIYKDILEVK